MEEIIKFGTAKLAKSKGLEMIANNLIGSNHSFYKDDGSIIRGDTYDKNHLFYAPPQSLLKKWLREEHNIHITVFPYTSEGIKADLVNNDDSYSYFIHWGVRVTDDGCDFDNYEEALEAGLRKGLKLIN